MNSVNFMWFILSQALYVAGTYIIMSSLFQLRIMRHIKKIAAISVIHGIINYLIYFNEDIAYIVPIISILITFLYLAVIVKVPSVWAFVVTVAGSVIVPLIIQLGLIFGSFGFFTPTALKEHIWRNYALDTVSGLVCVSVAFSLYSNGWNFTFDFEKIRFRCERYIVIVITSCAALCLPVTIAFMRVDFTLNLTFLSAVLFLMFLFFLWYAVKKERDEKNFLKGVKEHD